MNQRKKDKYANMSPKKRFFHKYTGFIIAAILMTTIVPYLWMVASEQEFFEKWNCHQLSIYLLSDDHNFQKRPTFTPEQEEKFQKVIAECDFSDVPLLNGK